MGSEMCIRDSLTTIATTTTIDIQNDMMIDTTTDMTADATAAAMTDMTTNTPNAMTTDMTTAIHNPQAAGDETATTLLPPTQMNLTTRDGAHTHLRHAARERANQPAEKKKRKTPNSTTWAKLPSSLA